MSGDARRMTKRYWKWGWLKVITFILVGHLSSDEQTLIVEERRFKFIKEFSKKSPSQCPLKNFSFFMTF